ncbi:MAG TPA: uroporphyrinogen-III synthase [Stellaceae bacterium]|nr:uroporphyrinogen-III synthase [Stellaceae bacterium]
MQGSLNGRRIVVPETRELDLLARMIEGEGGEAIRCPLVAIVDVSDPAPVAAWLGRFVGEPFDDLVLLTGEGLRRLYSAAVASGMENGFLHALARPRKITRGPKPAKALRELGLEPDLRAREPTTEGVIAALSQENLQGRRVGVQLYPDNPNRMLLDFLVRAGAQPDPVLPYAYASAAEANRVVEIIDQMAEGKVDVIAFTSSPQVRRLFDVARASRCEEKLDSALALTRVAAVGPVVAAELAARGVKVAIAPEAAYFMKPLVRAIAEAFAGEPLSP